MYLWINPYFNINYLQSKDLAPYLHVDVNSSDIKFENVSFSYGPGKDIFNNLSFTISPGKKVAIIGTSGSGYVKSA